VADTPDYGQTVSGVIPCTQPLLIETLYA